MMIMLWDNGGGEGNAWTDDEFSRNLRNEHVINLIGFDGHEEDKKETKN